MTHRSLRIGTVAIAVTTILAASVIPDVVWACDSCWGAKVDTPTTRGISMAMTALIGMTSLVWGGIGAFFFHVRRRSRLLEPGELIVTQRGDLREMKDRGADDEPC